MKRGRFTTKGRSRKKARRYCDGTNVRAKTLARARAPASRATTAARAKTPARARVAAGPTAGKSRPNRQFGWGFSPRTGPVVPALSHLSCLETCMPENKFNGFMNYGIGIGLRSPHYDHILSRNPVVDWF